MSSSVAKHSVGNEDDWGVCLGMMTPTRGVTNIEIKFVLEAVRPCSGSSTLVFRHAVTSSNPGDLMWQSCNNEWHSSGSFDLLPPIIISSLHHAYHHPLSRHAVPDLSKGCVPRNFTQVGISLNAYAAHATMRAESDRRKYTYIHTIKNPLLVNLVTFISIYFLRDAHASTIFYVCTGRQKFT